MDLRKIIEQLIDERNRVDAIIRSLQVMSGVHGKPAPRKRRGRKSMDEAARVEVSARMKKYWARRREGKGSSAGAGSPTEMERYSKKDEEPGGSRARSAAA